MKTKQNISSSKKGRKKSAGPYLLILQSGQVFACVSEGRGAGAPGPQAL